MNLTGGHFEITIANQPDYNVEELPDVNTQGETLEEVQSNLQEAI